MTTRPELRLGSHLVRGLAAVALFVVMAAVFVTAPFEAGQGFPSDANITASIGYAMFNLDLGSVPAEGFLVAFILIALALDVALDSALYLAKREQDDEPFTALLADGGRELSRSIGIGSIREESSEAEAQEETGGERR